MDIIVDIISIAIIMIIVIIAFVGWCFQKIKKTNKGDEYLFIINQGQ